MRIIQRDDVYYCILRVNPYRITIGDKTFMYYLVPHTFNYILGNDLAGISYDKDKNIFFVISESLDVYLMKIIIKGYVYQFNLEEKSKFDEIDEIKKQNYLDTVKYEFDLAIKYCERYAFNPARYLYYRLGILICMIDEMESKYQDINDIQLAIDFLTENLEYFICDPWQEDLLIKI